MMSETHCRSCGDALTRDDLAYDDNGYCYDCNLDSHTMTPEEEFEHYWNNPANQVEYTCQACSRKFTGHEARGPLGYCDTCADRIERGEDLYY